MLLKITGLDQLDGEYELDPQPNLREITAFRKVAGLTPSEMGDAFLHGGLEVLPLYVFTALTRQGRPDLASLVLDVPLDKWGGFDMSTEPEPGDDEIPPVNELDEHDSRSETA